VRAERMGLSRPAHTCLLRLKEQAEGADTRRCCGALRRGALGKLGLGRAMNTSVVPVRRLLGVPLLALALLASLLSALAPPPAEAQAAEPLDIVFSLDGSGSIDSADWALQKDGFSAAIQDQAAFPLDGSVRVGVVQWSSSVRTEIPLTPITDAASVAQLVSAIQGISQINSLTNPGDGLRHSADLLAAGNRRPADWVVCMSTDGTTNSGENLGTASAHAQAVGVDRYSVIGIQDGSFTEATANAHYGPHVFGGGTVAFARNTAEFTSLIIGTCMNDPIELVGLEVNQSIQNWENSITVIDGKRTVVRAFAQVKPGGDSERVTGRLHGTRNGSPLPGSPIAAINTGGTILVEEDVTDRRADLDASFNFVLPSTWTTGNVTLRFDGGGTSVECKEAAGPTPEDCSTTVDFKKMKRPKIKIVGVNYSSGGVNRHPTVTQRFEQGFRMESLFPVDRIDISTSALNTSWTAPPDLSDVNRRLSNQRLWDLCFSLFGCSDLYYGVVQGTGGGLANGIPGTVSSGYTRGTDNREDTGFFRNVGGHEVGHTLGLHHAVDNSLSLVNGLKRGYCGERASTSAPGHPVFGTLTGSSGSTTGPLLSALGDPDTEVWGIDTRFARNNVNDLAVVDPNVTGALLGYCWVGSPQDLWTAASEWDLLISGFESQFGTAAVPATTSGRHLVVSGAIDDLEADPQEVRFDPVGEIVADDIPVPPDGPYKVRVLAADDTVLGEVDFDIEEQHARIGPGEEEPPHTGMFVIPVPLDDDAEYAGIEVEKDGVVIGELTASDNAPTVSITAPTAGSVEDGATVLFSWDAGDADGDDVTSTVRYSPDEGVTWQTLGIDLEAEELEVDRSELASSTTAIFEVIVSDGVLSSSARSEKFTVAGDGPTILIESPLPGESFYSGIQTISMEAVVVDPIDGLIEDVTWSSDKDGVLGDEAKSTVTADTLQVGTHVLTASATNTRGETSSADVEIEVLRVAPPPTPPPPPPPGPGPAPTPPPVDVDEPTPPCPTFSDLTPARTHYDDVCAMAIDELILGFKDGTFRPGAHVTRGQVASVLARIAELEELFPPVPTFSDIAGTTHAGAIEALAEAGIGEGFPDGTFRPGATVRRDQLASLLARWLGIEGVEDGPFDDVPADNVHRQAINALHQLGIVSGTKASAFEPAAPVRRDQFAALVNRAR
jgi:hypothetical protein